MLNGFVLAKVNLHRPGCPRELENVIDNKDVSAPLVVVSNREKYGIGVYTPPAVLISGAARRSLLFKAGVVSSWAFIENGAIEIKADDAISSQELMEKLDVLLRTRLYGREGNPGPGQAYGYILQLYPFEDYFIYGFKGVKYRQPYTLNPLTRDVALRGGSTVVEEKFVDACVETMPRVQTGMRYYMAPPKGNKQTMTQGAKNSELITHIVRNWSDVNKAVATYLDAIKNGNYKPLRPSFYPVNLSDKGKVTAQLASKKVDAFSFAHWTCKTRG